MPYIRKEERERAISDPGTPGELNYAISRRMLAAFNDGAHPLALNVLHRSLIDLFGVYISGQDFDYDLCNEVLGAVAGAVMEFRRRIKPHPLTTIKAKLIARAIGKTVDQFYAGMPASYENKKIYENGDIGYELL